MIWTVHSKPTRNPELLAETMAVIPEGTSKWALLFAPFWLAFHGLWLALIAYLIFISTVLALFSTPWFWGAYVVAGLPGLYLWLEGNQLRRGRLERRGYGFLGVVEAGTADAAELRAVATFTPKSVEPTSAAPLHDRRIRPNGQAQTESIGLFGA